MRERLYRKLPNLRERLYRKLPNLRERLYRKLPNLRGRLYRKFAHVSSAHVCGALAERRKLGNLRYMRCDALLLQVAELRYITSRWGLHDRFCCD